MFYNNVVKVNSGGTGAYPTSEEKALAHYFGHLGDIDAKAFKEAVEQKINTKITEMTTAASSESEIETQKEIRIESETTMNAQTGYRITLALPELQSYPPSDRIQDLAKSIEVSFTDIVELDDHVRMRLLMDTGGVRTLVNDLRMPWADLLALDARVRNPLLDHSKRVKELVNTKGIEMSRFISLTEEQQQAIIDNPSPENLAALVSAGTGWSAPFLQAASGGATGVSTSDKEP